MRGTTTEGLVGVVWCSSLSWALVSFAVILGGWENFFYAFEPFFCVDLVLKFQDAFWRAEFLECAVFSLSLNLYAVVDHAA